MKKTLLLFSLLFSFSLLSAQVTLNQVDDFQDGTTQQWRIGGAGNATDGPVNIPNGGPAGAGDNCLQYTSNGNSGMVASKMVFFSQNQQWSGDFISEGVDQITMNVRVQTTALNLRIAMQGGGTQICTTNAVSVAANGSWTSITIPISPSDFTVVSGAGDATTVLSNVLTLRILSSTNPTWLDADEVSAIIEVDNITAQSSLSTPEFEANNAQFEIKPNPSKDKLNIVLPTNTDVKLEVFDVLGKRVYNGTISQLSSSIDVTNWRSGVYLVRVSNDSATQTKRFIKQ
ncbi:T9SS type A sorting domain-containing protein [Winogradskyella tangerina]|uniref:T9SS type A sorting domain-containing protein n=1 Tax=Winogradskyella tangerina TaxID=2023240 RepID=UPI000DBE1CF4|nr:T9SS type A sorting domain-containing protein [Winogradskyella tangerina]